MFRNVLGVLGPFTTEIFERIDEFEWSLFLEGVSFDLVWSVITLPTSSYVTWIGTALLNTSFPHPREAREVFDLPGGRNTHSRNLPFDDHSPITDKLLLYSAVRFDTTSQLSMQEACTNVIGFGGTQVLGSGAVGGDSARLSSIHIWMIRMVMTGILLMCWKIINSRLVPVFVHASIQ